MISIVIAVAIRTSIRVIPRDEVRLAMDMPLKITKEKRVYGFGTSSVLAINDQATLGMLIQWKGLCVGDGGC